MPKPLNKDNSKHAFGIYGGQYVPEVLMSALDELDAVYKRAKKQVKFQKTLSHYLCSYAGRPTPLTHARNLSNRLGCTVFLKREDLLHTGAHKINNTIGQALLTQWMKKKRIIAETGAGQHGVATATVAALFKIPCTIYMGEKDMKRQSLNVFRMRLLGAEVVMVRSGSRTLKDAINEAIRDWITNVRSTHYILGSAVGPSPYPEMVRDFQSVIGKETRSQLKGNFCDLAIACVGGGSNAIGLFHPFLKSKTKLWGIEAAGKGLDTPLHAATLSKGSVGVLHGSKSYLLQNRYGQIQEAHSISAGLDYPGVGPEHAMLKDTGRAQYFTATDKDALNGFQFLSREEGIIPALESSHAIGYLLKNRRKLRRIKTLVICLSGRGDKDVEEVSHYLRLKK